MMRCLAIRAAAGRLLAPAAAFLLLATGLAAAPAASAQSYSVAPIPFAWIPTAGHTVLTTWAAGLGCPDTVGDDSLSLPLNIGFAFRFGTTSYTQLRVYTNGRVQFGNTRCTFGTQSAGPPRTYPDPMPSALVNDTIRIYGADLDASDGGRITVASLGTAPNRVYVVTWNDVPQWGLGSQTSYNLQVQLYENGEFQFHYGVNDNTGPGRTRIAFAQYGWQLTPGDYYAVTNLPANNSALRFRPNAAPQLVVAKSVDVLSDPVNATTNPKRIPGSVQRHAVTVRNAGSGWVDANSLVVTEPVPATTELCVAAACGPVVEFVDGAPASGLALPTGAVTYSSQPGGGPPYTYVPVPNAAGYDATVRGVRIAPSGTMNPATAAGQPSFTVRWRVRVR